MGKEKKVDSNNSPSDQDSDDISHVIDLTGNQSTAQIEAPLTIRI